MAEKPGHPESKAPPDAAGPRSDSHANRSRRADPEDQQLVRRITEQVLRRLRAISDNGPNDNRAAQLRPTIGVCTGDYSQFQDRPDLRAEGRAAPSGSDASAPHTPNAPDASAGPPPASSSASLSQTQATSQADVLSGFVTAARLEEAMRQASDGRALLAADARLTPLAADFARENPDRIRRLSRSSTSASHGEGRLAPWMVWVQGDAPAVEQTLDSLGEPIMRSSATQLADALRGLVDGLRGGRVAGGLLLVSSAAWATVSANRVPMLRAVVASDPDSAREAIDQVQANVVIVDYRRWRPDRLGPLLRWIARATPKRPSPQLARELSEMARLSGW